MPYTVNVAEVLGNLERFHSNFYAGGTFRGPSLHFHQRSLATGNGSDFERHIEYIYATLVSWGMHRMGKGGSKMRSFEIFYDSVLPMRNMVSALRQKRLNDLRPADWDDVERLFKSIKVMATGTYLVGHSKVMAHLIPNIAAPIDRNYTLSYLRGHTRLPNDLDAEWRLFREIHTEFFLPVATSEEFKEKFSEWLTHGDEYPWDTSLLKVIDNLLIAGASHRASEGQ